MVVKRTQLIIKIQKVIGASVRQLRWVLGLGKFMVEQALNDEHDKRETSPRLP